MKRRPSNYDKFPSIRVPVGRESVWQGWPEIQPQYQLAGLWMCSAAAGSRLNGIRHHRRGSGIRHALM